MSYFSFSLDDRFSIGSYIEFVEATWDNHKAGDVKQISHIDNNVVWFTDNTYLYPMDVHKTRPHMANSYWDMLVFYGPVSNRTMYPAFHVYWGYDEVLDYAKDFTGVVFKIKKRKR